MRNLSQPQREPFLWVHFAGLALVPVWLFICALGFAVSEPLLPWNLEWMLVALVGLLPALWMQWRRPFYVFSLGPVALQPMGLTNDQRRLLSWFHRPGMKLRALLIALLLALLVEQCYNWSPLLAGIGPLEGKPRLVGLGLAAIATWGLSRFVQVPIAVAPLLAMKPAQRYRLEAYERDRISAEFSILGLTLPVLLPGILMEPLSTVIVAATEVGNVPADSVAERKIAAEVEAPAEATPIDDAD